MSETTEDLYAILEIKKDATPREIKKAYRKLALKYHPDKNAGNEVAAKEQFQKVEEAYRILSHPHKRKEYDEKGCANSQDPESVFTYVINHHMTHITGLPVPPPPTENIIQGIKEATIAEVVKLEADLVTVLNKIKNVERLKKRIIHKGAGKNLFWQALDKNIADFEMQLLQNTENIRQQREFIKYLDEYDFKAEPLKPSEAPAA